MAANTPAIELVASGLVNGVTCYFTVAATNSAGESANATPVLARPTAATPPPLTLLPNPETLELSWPASHTGWLLQSQTNAIGLGLAATWVTIAEAGETNRISIPLDQHLGSVFFRLIHP